MPSDLRKKLDLLARERASSEMEYLAERDAMTLAAQLALDAAIDAVIWVKPDPRRPGWSLAVPRENAYDRLDALRVSLDAPTPGEKGEG